MPTSTSVSQPSKAIALAWLPSSPDWPTSKSLSSSSPSFALSVSTIGAPQPLGERQHLGAGVARALSHEQRRPGRPR